MIDSDDKSTFHSFHNLIRSVRTGDKPLCLWVGAGVSRWLGYPSWGQFAIQTQKEFLRGQPGYPAIDTAGLLGRHQYADLFEIQKSQNVTLFNDILVRSFKSRKMTPVYERFARSLESLAPRMLITTNIDSALESRIADLNIVHSSDISRIPGLINQRSNFLLKLHGTIGDAASVVFSKSDYSRLMNDSFVANLSTIFHLTSVLFIGYGLGDSYIVRLLRKSDEDQPILGSGPHYIVTPKRIDNLPSCVQQIRYLPIPRKDHRSSLHVLEEIAGRSDLPLRSANGRTTAARRVLESAHLISDIYAPGTWETSHSLEVVSTEDGVKRGRIVVGNGLSNDEIRLTPISSMEDLLIGLICFDRVLCPFTAGPRIVKLIGEPVLNELLSNSTMRLVQWDDVLAIDFEDQKETGSLTKITIVGEQGKSTPELEHPEGRIDWHLRRAYKPVVGREAEYERTLEVIRRSILTTREDRKGLELNVVYGLLMRPSIRRMIGMSEGTPARSIPPWLTHSVMRLAHIVRVGVTCENHSIASVRFEFGAHELVGAAFASVWSAEWWAANAANYVVTGSLQGSIGAYALAEPRLLRTILRFRETPQGLALRKSVLECLQDSRASDFSPTIESAMARLVPMRVLESAKDRFSELLASEVQLQRIQPIAWAPPDNKSAELALWRARSRKSFRQFCSERRIKESDLCPCGSGELVKDCCKRALIR